MTITKEPKIEIMKKTMKLGFMMTLLSGLMFFASCDDNDEITPVDPNAEYDAILRLSEAATGDTTTATVNVDANTQSTIKARVTFLSTSASMRRLYITQNVGGQGDEPFEITANVDKKADGSIDIEAANSNGIVYELTLPVPSGVGSGTVVYELWTTTGRGDYRDQTQRLAVGPGTITLNYGGANEAAEVKSFSAKLLDAPLADGSSETFISLLDGQVYKINQGEEYVDFWDFGYYYGATGKASLASTDDYPSSVIDIETIANTSDALNTAYFALSSKTSADFDAIAVSGDLSFVTKPTSQRINQLAAGNIIEFVDHYGKKGLIRVTEINGTDGSDGYIEIDVKVQP
ncbi:hypothetical protein LVD17_24895 [Fulvivirga ulvae]|uniref:hypothetical protein n=1 Tax=Fulvivirga ulvae TaxID=2904245 RepID=UPI001F211BA7|nr:hypothetical protein [Fulvivirga ulvae]UII31536.1 hypothetical protein LVD17_24895 [Fulvivirga ulvae]